MIVYYDATERVDEYGKAKFYEVVREHIAEIFERSGLEITGSELHGTDKSIIEIYQRYAYAFVIGVLMGDVTQFRDNFYDEFTDPIGMWKSVEDRSGELLLSQGHVLTKNAGPAVIHDEEGEFTWGEVVIPNTTGSAEQHTLGRNVAEALFLNEMGTQSGLAGLVRQLYPGRYLNHYGDDFKGLVVVCEYEGLL